MTVWKKNLFVCWFGVFVTGVGMSQIAPVMPLYVKHLGVVEPRLSSSNSRESPLAPPS